MPWQQGSVEPSSSWVAPDEGLGKLPTPSLSASKRGHTKNEQVGKDWGSGPTLDMAPSHVATFCDQGASSRGANCSLRLWTLLKSFAQAPTKEMRWIRREGVQPSRHATKACNCFVTNCGACRSSVAAFSIAVRSQMMSIVLFAWRSKALCLLPLLGGTWNAD